MKKFIFFIIIAILIALIIENINDFSRGIAPNNQVCLIDYSQTKYKTDILSRYIDTFLSKHPKYDAIKQGYSIDSSLSFLSLRKIYFGSYPIEIYTIRGDYYICIRTVDNLYTGKTLAFHANEYENELKTNVEELKRIQSRFQTEILDSAIKYIEQSNIADSIKYIAN